MKIITFNGRQRKRDNIEQVIEEVFKTIRKDETHTTRGKLLRGYASCYSCFQSKDRPVCH